MSSKMLTGASFLLQLPTKVAETEPGCKSAHVSAKCKPNDIDPEFIYLMYIVKRHHCFSEFLVIQISYNLCSVRMSADATENCLVAALWRRSQRVHHSITGQTTMPDPLRPSAPKWPNMRHLRLLEIAEREGSLTRAAQAVNISQPAASQAIAKLAHIFGAPLLERVGNAAVATPEGKIVTRRARRALMHLRDPSLSPHGRVRQINDDLLERYASTTQLRVMALFALTGSFAATAQALGQTEASVRRASKDVEQIIGQSVLEGDQRKRTLSATGTIVATRASLALREIDLAHSELREKQGVFDSRLVIGALPLARTQIVPRAAVRLLEKYPSATLEILDGSYEFLLQRLRLGACDMIIGALRDDATDHDLLESRLFTDTLRVVARVGHPLAGRKIRGQDLGRFPWILPRRDAPARRVFEALAKSHGLDSARLGHIETGSLVVLRGVMLASDTLTLISPNQISYEIEESLMEPLDIVLQGAEREIGVTEQRNNMPGLLHSDFLEFVADEARKL